MLFISATTQAQIQKFNIGIVIPLSGDLAEYGTSIKNGFELAKSQNHEKFKNINYIYEDSRYDGKTAVLALNNLRVMHAVDIYYLWGVSPTEAMLPIAKAQKMPVIAETTVKEATLGNPLVIRAARTGERIAKALAQELFSRNVKKISLIITEIPFYSDIAKHLENELQQKGIELISKASVDATHSDFKPFLWGKKNIKDEVVGVFLLPAQLISYYRQMHQFKMKIQTFNADLLDRETLIRDCPDTIDTAFFSQVGVTNDFRKEYKKKFGNDIQIGSAAQSYDVAILLAELFGNNLKKLSNKEIINTISKISPREGATGKFRYTDTADSGKEIRMPVSIKQVKDKNIITLSEDSGF